MSDDDRDWSPGTSDCRTASVGTTATGWEHSRVDPGEVLGFRAEVRGVELRPNGVRRLEMMRGGAGGERESGGGGGGGVRKVYGACGRVGSANLQRQPECLLERFERRAVQHRDRI